MFFPMFIIQGDTMKEMARVIEKDNGNATVRIIRSSACSKCDEKCMLGEQSHEVDEMDVVVKDPIGAEVGSMVELEMGAKPILLSAFMVYLLPLFAIVAGYFAGEALFSIFTSSTEVAGILGSAAAFFLSFLLLRAFDKKAGSKSYFHPKIIRVVNHNGFFYEQ